MNCIWITTDSFRQDHVHCYRPEGTIDETGESIQVQTPNIDRLAAEGVRFDRMLAEALPTIPCRRGLFTGRRVFPWPDEPTCKGMYVRLPGWRPLPQGDVTVAEHLSEQGCVTAIVSDVYHLMKPSQNFHRGFHSFQWERGQEFDQWQSQPLPAGYLEQHLLSGTDLKPYRLKVLVQYLKNQMYRSDDEEFQAARTFRRAIEWLERNHTHEKFFLYIDSFDPHEPFDAPQRFINLYDPDYAGPKLVYANPYQRSDLTDAQHHHVRARYAAACTMVDHWIGRLLETVNRLGLRDKTLIILVSDHGKIIGEFGHYGMPAQDLGPALAPVPCIIRAPGHDCVGRRFAGWLYNIDVTATMLSLMAVEPKPGVEGRNVWPAVSSSAEDFRDHLVTAYGPMIACWREDWLYLVNTRENTAALYNLAEDIHRKENVADQYPQVRDDLARQLAAAAEQ